MRFEANKLATVVGVLSILLGGWATSAQAQQQYSLTGNARFQIGDGLPIPIRSTAAPNGGVFVGGGFAPGTAVVTQQGADPMTLSLPAGMLKNPPLSFNLPLLANNAFVFQVNTTVVASFPFASKTFKAGGRPGAAIVAWCPGDGVVTGSGNPACAGAAAPGGTGGNLINGRMVYTANGLATRFGGNMGGTFAGTASVALNPFVNNIPSTGCGGATCKVAFAKASPAANPGATSGASWGNSNMTNGNVEDPGVFFANISNGGRIVTLLSPTAPAPNPGPTNKATSHFGPWTTGMITVTQNSIVPPETLVLTGSDMRVNGVGSISLVSGTIAARAVSGGNANRGWLNFNILAEVDPTPTPAMSPAGLATLVSLMGLAGGYGMMRRRAGKK